MNFTIITSCSSRKRNIGVPPLLPSLTEATDTKNLLISWLKQVKESTVKVSPLDLYQGRSIAESRASARLMTSDFYVISAGLGLVSASEQVPNYSLTISEGTGSIQKWLSEQGLTAEQWWKALSDALGTPSPVSDLVNRKSTDSRIFIALPASYMVMIATDLAKVDSNQLENVRIFTSIAGAKHVPSALLKTVIPYDERLEGIANHGGTRSDFPQRAMKHFIAELHAHELSLEDAKVRVHSAMTNSVHRITPKRIKVPDSKIADLIRSQWNLYEGSSSKLLRHLRDVANVACEQSRFSSIWREIRSDQLAIKEKINA